jgi:tetratricopeptide (TPR) repeat protein
LDQNNALSNVLVNLQQSLEEQRRREVQLSEESRSFNGRVMFGAGAAIFLVFLASYWFQLRCLNRVMEVTRATHELPAPFAPALLEAAKEAANTRESKLLEAIKLLEDRIRRFEIPANGAAPAPVAPSARPAATPAMIVSGPNQPVFKGTMENGHAAPEAKPSGAVPAADEAAPAEEQSASEVSVLLAKGEILLEAERMQEAVNVFNEALALDPNNAEAHLKKGIGLERLNRLELALTSYNEALRLNPKRSFAYVYKARVLAALHRYDEALVVYDMALGKAKPNANAEPVEVNRTKTAV